MNHRRWATLALTALLIPVATACQASSTGSNQDPPPKPGNVAVLVVDDFATTDRPAPTANSLTGTCTVATNEVGTNGAGDGDLGGNTHGAVVYRVLQQQLDKLLGQVTPSTGPATDGTATEWKVPVGSNFFTVRLVAVNVPGYTTTSGVAAVNGVMSNLKGTYSRFVLNLSFVTIPCNSRELLSTTDQQDLFEWYKDLVSNGDTTLQKAVEDAVGKGPFDTEKFKKLDGPVITDKRLAELRKCLVAKTYKEMQEDLPKGDGKVFNAMKAGDTAWKDLTTGQLGKVEWASVVRVGAAGNGIICKPSPKKNADGTPARIRFPFPFAPALWAEFVVSVSAEKDNVAADYGNAGEVRFADDPPTDLAKNSRGSSYSAARVSGGQAKYLLLTGYLDCGGKPTLGYLDSLSGISFTPSSPWANTAKANWTCKDFVSVTGI